MTFQTLFRSPSLLSLILALPFGLAPGCGQTIDLGGNNNLGYEPCPVDDGCADMAHPALACAYGAGDWACVELDSGACSWNLLCPDEPDVCSPSDCSADRPAIACGSGGDEWLCEPQADGSCGWRLECPEPDLCDESECPEVTFALPECGDGISGSYECRRDATGVCNWDDVCPPSDACTPEDCGDQSHIALACADGSDGWVCDRDDASGSCRWNLECDDDPGVACTEADCADMPHIALACADGSDGWECVVDAAGDCSWNLACEPTTCDESDCEGLDMPAFADCEGPATGVLTCEPQAGGCGWNFECVDPSEPTVCPDPEACDDVGRPELGCADGVEPTFTCLASGDGSCHWDAECVDPSVPREWEVSDCPDAHAALACADGSANWQCVYTATMECDWLLECPDGSDPSVPPMSGS